MTTRSRKLSSSGRNDAEHEAIRKVARSVRGEVEPDQESKDRAFLDRLDEYFQRLEGEDAPSTSPLRELREILGLTRQEGAAFFNYSYTRWCAIEDGGASFVPNSAQQILKNVYGPSAGAVLEKAWRRWRENMAAEVRAEVEKRLFPAGTIYGMAP